MNTAAVLSALAAALGAGVGALTLRASRAPGWRELRWLALVSFLSSAHATVGLAFTWPLPEAAFPFSALLVRLADLAIVLASARYARDLSQGDDGKRVLSLEVLLVAAGVVAVIACQTAPPGGLSGTGKLVVAVLLVGVPGALLALARHRTSRLRGERLAGVHSAALLSLLLVAALDIATAGSRAALPRLLDLGILPPLGLIGWASALRFLEAARDLAALRERLESLVEERTRELLDAREALVRSERLASLGQLANGVAHQVSNPASVVTANLNYLAENVVRLREDREIADDALAAMRRINQLVRRLADAGRIAVVPRSSTAVELGEAVKRALAEARPSLPDEVALESAIPAGLHVKTRVEVLEQVLGSLLSNAAEALPKGRPGKIEVRAERRESGIRLTVKDDGVGMVPEVLERAFEPFFTTKPPGEGSGLGLPISRGIVELHGGALWLESAPAQGTTAILVLPETQAA